MPRYFFNVRGPDTFDLDEIGIELRDLDEARAKAEQGSRDILAEYVKAGRTVDHQRFEICDEDGALLLVVVFRDVLVLPEGPAEDASGA